MIPKSTRLSEEPRTVSRAVILVLAVLLVVGVGSLLPRQGALRAAHSPVQYLPTTHGPYTLADPLPESRRGDDGEAVQVLNEIKTLEWAYRRLHGTFTRNMRTLGVVLPSGSLFIYSIPRATHSQLVVEAFGRPLTPASGIELTLFMNSNGRHKLVRSR